MESNNKKIKFLNAIKNINYMGLKPNVEAMSNMWDLIENAIEKAENISCIMPNSLASSLVYQVSSEKNISYIDMRNTSKEIINMINIHNSNVVFIENVPEERITEIRNGLSEQVKMYKLNSESLGQKIETPINKDNNSSTFTIGPKPIITSSEEFKGHKM